MADISICPAIRMPPSFRGVSSVAFGAGRSSYGRHRRKVCPWPDSNRRPSLTGLLCHLSYKDIYPFRGTLQALNGFSCVPWLLPLSGEGNGPCRPHADSLGMGPDEAGTPPGKERRRPLLMPPRCRATAALATGPCLKPLPWYQYTPDFRLWRVI